MRRYVVPKHNHDKKEGIWFGKADNQPQLNERIMNELCMYVNVLTEDNFVAECIIICITVVSPAKC